MLLARLWREGGNNSGWMSQRNSCDAAYIPLVPRGLKRYQQAHDLHFITFSCYHRMPLLRTALARHVFEETLGHVRCWYGLFVTGYVVMPEHVHLLISEPERAV